MTKSEHTLGDFRKKIDNIDDQIIRLLKERVKIVKQVGELKSTTSKSQSFIRAGREATMLRDLTTKLEGTFPPQAVATIWRMIISTSLCVEQDININVFATESNRNCYWQAREYYGTFVDIKSSDDTHDIIEHVSSSHNTVGILPLTDNSEKPWWIRPQDESNSIYVFARIPFIESNSPQDTPVLAIANTIPEPTENDISLITITSSQPKAAIEAAFDKAGLALNFLAQHDRHFLTEVNQFIDMQNSHIEDLARNIGNATFVRLLGSYAAPIVLKGL